jgi:hypothetical protein
MGIVDDLLANPGLYIGIDRVMDSDLRGAARIAVTPLPGRVGVALDYEVFNGSMPENPRGHVEHTLIARAHSGKVIMVIADTHSGALTILEEGEPGVFEPEADAALPYPREGRGHVSRTGTVAPRMVVRVAGRRSRRARRLRADPDDLTPRRCC